jgi:hypothetical protein
VILYRYDNTVTIRPNKGFSVELLILLLALDFSPELIQARLGFLRPKRVAVIIRSIEVF